ncbi:MAG: diaminopimelate epimerase [Myxococcota bacterium]
MQRTLWKYQGTGNDFIILDERTRGRTPSADEARSLCDRHFGVGADGILTVLPAATSDARARMHITNADGSVPEMCGNGLRCVAAFLEDHDGKTGPGTFVVETDAGPRRCHVQPPRDGERQISLGMGRVRFGADAGLPALERTMLEGREVRALSVSVGNPHLVMDVAPDVAQAERVGAEMVGSAGFPHGCNVEWVVREGDGLRVLVYERGVGITMACGTGAVASAFAAERWGWVKLDGEGVRVKVPGGTLRIARAADGEALLTGPARKVFTASI